MVDWWYVRGNRKYQHFPAPLNGNLPIIHFCADPKGRNCIVGFLFLGGIYETETDSVIGTYEITVECSGDK